MKRITITYTADVMDRDVEWVKQEVEKSICAEMDGSINLYLDCPLMHVKSEIKSDDIC